MSMPQFARQTAVICTLEDINEGEWVQRESPDPSGIRTSKGFLSRVNIIGVIVERPTEQSIVFEDGTGRMTARSFDPLPQLDRVDVGDVVLVIGRPREYNGERYIVLEICKKLDKRWVVYRQKQLGVKQELKEELSGNPVQDTLTTIRELDDGGGADVDAVIKRVGDERIITTLLEEGEIFEMRPGKVKVLE